jgi:hypothetical protein
MFGAALAEGGRVTHMDTSDRIALALSLLSFVVSIFACGYTRSQAKAAKSQAEAAIEANAIAKRKEAQELRDRYEAARPKFRPIGAYQEGNDARIEIAMDSGPSPSRHLPTGER